MNELQIVIGIVVLSVCGGLAGIVGFIFMCGYYEWRRSDRIRRNLPLDDTQPARGGFPVETGASKDSSGRR